MILNKIKNIFTKNTGNTNTIFITLSILTGSIIIASSIYLKPQQDTQNNLVYEADNHISRQEVKNFKSLTNIKDKNTKVTALIFTDTECVFCKKFQMETLDKLIEKYNKDIDFKYIFLPFRGEKSVEHMMYAHCASEQNISNNDDEYRTKYYNYIKSMFESNNLDGQLNKEELLSLAEKSGLNSTDLRVCIDKINTDIQFKAQKEEKIKKEYEFAVSKEVNSTPQIFILKENPQDKDEYIIYSKIIGAREMNYFEKILDKALK